MNKEKNSTYVIVKQTLHRTLDMKKINGIHMTTELRIILRFRNNHKLFDKNRIQLWHSQIWESSLDIVKWMIEYNINAGLCSQGTSETLTYSSEIRTDGISYECENNPCTLQPTLFLK